MQSFFTNYLNNLKELHDDLRHAVNGLPPNALDWTSGPEMNSISVLVVHLTGAERYWIGDVVAGEPSGRDREAEFKTRGLGTDELIQRLSQIEAYIEQALDKLTLPALDEPRISPRNGRAVTVGWALGHALKHTALHLGHIQIMRQLWDQQKASQDQ
jgi:uncharacterized damage-inducible protein DinB